MIIRRFFPKLEFKHGFYHLICQAFIQSPWSPNNYINRNPMKVRNLNA